MATCACIISVSQHNRQEPNDHHSTSQPLRCKFTWGIIWVRGFQRQRHASLPVHYAIIPGMIPLKLFQHPCSKHYLIMHTLLEMLTLVHCQYCTCDGDNIIDQIQLMLCLPIALIVQVVPVYVLIDSMVLHAVEHNFPKKHFLFSNKVL